MTEWSQLKGGGQQSRGFPRLLRVAATVGAGILNSDFLGAGDHGGIKPVNQGQPPGLLPVVQCYELSLKTTVV
jgi:hypothetical protein